MAERAKGRAKRAKQTDTPKASKTRADAGPPPAGHNGGVPDEIYQRYLSKIATAEIAYDKAAEVAKSKKGELRSIYAAAKEDGCNIDAIKFARSLNKQDVGTVAMDISDAGRVLRLMKSPLAVQLNLFADTQMPPPENPYLAGQHAGKNGEPAGNNPHKPGSQEFETWAEGYESGQQGLREGFRGSPLN